MSPLTHRLVIVLALALGFLALNTLAASLLTGLRLDVTENRLYTLSNGTREVLAGLDEPVSLTLYFTPEAAAAVPIARAHGERVRALLRTYAARSNGKIQLTERNPVPFSAVEDEALAAGLEGIAPADGADPIYLGLVVRNDVDDTRVIPFLAPERDASLEYDITAALADLARTERPRIAVITSLPWLFGPDSNGEGGMLIGAQIAENHEVTVLDPEFDRLPERTDLLLIAQPPALSAWQQYLIDHFARSRGRLLVLVDPASVTAAGVGGEATLGSKLGALLSAWGVSIGRDAVMDRAAGLPVSVAEDGRTLTLPQPLYLLVPQQGLSTTDITTASLPRGINFGAPGSLDLQPRTGVSAEALVRSSPDSAALSAERALSQPSPRSLLEGYTPSGGEAVLAARLSGTFATAFPEGPPPPPSPETQVPAAVSTASANAQMIIIADTDLLNDSFYLTAPDQPPSADNAAFVLNAIDSLTGAEALLSLRSRAPANRPLVVIERLRAAAIERSLDEQRTLEAELATTQQRLADLEARNRSTAFAGGDATASLSPAEGTELERFRQRLVEIRGSLRAVERRYRADIDRIKALIMAVTMGVVPGLVLFVGVVGFVLRRRAAAP